jgi:hypothetical protein
MSFIVQISPFVHLLTLKIVYQKPRRKLFLHLCKMYERNIAGNIQRIKSRYMITDDEHG